MNKAKLSAPRLYTDRELVGPEIALDAGEAHYMTQVLRLRRGDPIVLFNGRGQEMLTTLALATKRGASLETVERLEPQPESRLRLVLLQALVKADAMDLIVQKATELGVHALKPLLTRHSVVRLDAERAARRLEHWRKVSRSACEQCGRHKPLEIDAPRPLADGGFSPPAGTLGILLDPGSAEPLAQQSAPTGVWLLNGPEGGFDAEDLRLIDAAGFRRARLGPRILRAETAALAACSLAQAYWGDLT